MRRRFSSGEGDANGVHVVKAKCVFRTAGGRAYVVLILFFEAGNWYPVISLRLPDSFMNDNHDWRTTIIWALED